MEIEIEFISVVIVVVVTTPFHSQQFSIIQRKLIQENSLSSVKPCSETASSKKISPDQPSPGPASD